MVKLDKEILTNIFNIPIIVIRPMKNQLPPTEFM